MSESERERKLKELESAFNKPGGAQALRFVLSTLGIVPIAGGAISGAGALWAEKEQVTSNNLFLDWAQLADSEISQISETLRRLTAEPSKASMALLLGEILGSDSYSVLLANSHIPVILHPSTTAELEPYISKRWLQLTSTGSSCAMGAHNRIGDHVEELKRPFGTGSGFTLSITPLGSVGN